MASSSKLIVSKSEAIGECGMLATKHRLASDAGVEILEAGGNAVDAAVASCLAVGVVEPGSSGLGGGGYLVCAIEGKVESIAFQMQSPAAADPSMFALTGETSTGVFEWAGVENDANLIGPLSIAIPGAVAGLAMALEKYGTMPWREVVQPAINLARDGFELDWYDLYVIGVDQDRICYNAEASRIFLQDGGLPVGDGVTPNVFRQPDLAMTLERLAEAGPRDFYAGDISRSIVSGLEDLGAVLSLDDFAQYRAKVIPPQRSEYRDTVVCVPPFACAGPTTLATLNIYKHFDVAHLGCESAERLHVFICAARLARADRMAFMADPSMAEVPWDGLASEGYGLERAAQIDVGMTPHEFAAGNPWCHQASGGGTLPVTREGPEGSTTHLCAADRDGNMVSLTNTIMAGFGSGVVPRGTGIVMNNGMMWFNPEPGYPNSVSPCAKPLNNMTPTLVLHNGQPILAIGATGGRRITNAVCQIISNVVDHGMSIQSAVSAPRLDCCTAITDVDDRYPSSILNNLRAYGHSVNPLKQSFRAGFGLFASPTGIFRRSDGTYRGGVDPFHSAVARGV